MRKIKESEKIDKYLDLSMWNMKVAEIAIIVGARWTIPKGSGKEIVVSRNQGKNQHNSDYKQHC